MNSNLSVDLWLFLTIASLNVCSTGTFLGMLLSGCLLLFPPVHPLCTTSSYTSILPKCTTSESEHGSEALNFLSGISTNLTDNALYLCPCNKH